MAGGLERKMCCAQRWSLAQSLKEQPRAAHVKEDCLPSATTSLVHWALVMFAEHCYGVKATCCRRRPTWKVNMS